MNRNISVRVIVKGPSFFKTETMAFKVNNNTTWNQVSTSLHQRDGEKYQFFDSYGIPINTDGTVDIINQKIYAISESSIKYNATDLSSYQILY
jgi:hypothetical protein